MQKEYKEYRLNQFLASAGICSRREADRLIEEGRVSVNGADAVLGQKVTEADKVLVDGKSVQGRKETIVIALNKPAGYVCTREDAHAAKTVYDLLPKEEYLSYAGRLDADSEGLLLFSNDGELTHRMMQGSADHEKEYEVTIDAPVTEELLSRLRRGVYITQLSRKTKPCKAEKTGERSFRIILTQGMNRQIRRMCEECGCRVTQLRRIRVVNITLGDLPVGKWRVLAAEEVDELRRILS